MELVGHCDQTRGARVVLQKGTVNRDGSYPARVCAELAGMCAILLLAGAVLQFVLVNVALCIADMKAAPPSSEYNVQSIPVIGYAEAGEIENSSAPPTPYCRQR